MGWIKVSTASYLWLSSTKLELRSGKTGWHQAPRCADIWLLRDDSMVPRSEALAGFGSAELICLSCFTNAAD